MMTFVYVICGLVAFYGGGFVIACICSSITNKREYERNAKYAQIKKSYRQNPNYFDDNPSEYAFYAEESKRYHFEHSQMFMQQIQQERDMQFLQESAQACIEAGNRAMDEFNNLNFMNSLM